MIKFIKEGKILMTEKDSGELDIKDEKLAKEINEAMQTAKKPEGEKPKE